MRYKHIEKILKQYSRFCGITLDIGCGNSPYRDLFHDYVGVDLAITNCNMGNIDIYCNGEILPFKKKSFELVFMVGCLYQIQNSQAVLAETRRVLKRNGILLIFDYNLKTTKILKQSEKGGNNQNHVWSPFKLAAMVRKAGFKTSIIYDYSISESTVRFWKLKIVRYLKFLVVQIFRREGWGIVLGRKV